MEKVNLLSPSVLAFVGDGVYGLCVRKKLALVNRPSGELHKLSVEFVKATAQAKAFQVIKDILTEDEMAVFKRGRNFHTSSTPKSATNKEYHLATGLEALFGHLYLSEKQDRINQLFEVIWNSNEKE